MSLYKFAERDGKTIVVDLFSGRRYPQDEEAYILASLKPPPIKSEHDDKDEDSKSIA